MIVFFCDTYPLFMDVFSYEKFKFAHQEQNKFAQQEQNYLSLNENLIEHINQKQMSFLHKSLLVGVNMDESLLEVVVILN